MTNIYDDDSFFKEYANMERSKGLEKAGEWYQLKNLFPDVKGKNVLDLGYGYGWHCKEAVKRGALHVLGIDMSTKMIREAEVRNADEKITYRICGIEEYEYPLNTYDLVISNLALHYIEDIQAVYRHVYQTLKESGIFLFNIEHPVFTSGVREEWVCNDQGKPLYWPIDNYFYPGKRETVFLGKKVMKYHHTLTQILHGLLECGFEIEDVEEAMPSEEARVWMRDEMRRPMMLMVKAKKRESVDKRL